MVTKIYHFEFPLSHRDINPETMFQQNGAEVGQYQNSFPILKTLSPFFLRELEVKQNPDILRHIWLKEGEWCVETSETHIG